MKPLSTNAKPSRRGHSVYFVEGNQKPDGFARKRLNYAARRHAMLAVTRAKVQQHDITPNEDNICGQSVPPSNLEEQSLRILDAGEKAQLPYGELPVEEDRPVNSMAEGHAKLQQPEQVDFKALLPSRPRETLQYPILPTSGPFLSNGVMSVAETAQWLFHSHLRDSQAPFFLAAKEHWVDRLWAAAKRHPLALRCVSLSMLLKKAALLGNLDWSAYYADKAALISELRSSLNSELDSSFTSALPLIIAMLAEFESREAKDTPNARMHVKALARLMPIKQFQNIAWRYAVRVDLRQALWTGQHPILPYWIPPEYSKPIESNLTAMQQDICLQLASEDSDSVPTSMALSDQWSFHLFFDMHLMSSSWDALLADSEPPFGHVYSLAYRIRVYYATERASQKQLDNDVLVDLTLIAMQVQTWILSRYWVAQIPQVQSATLGQGFNFLQEDLLIRWLSRASLNSLLWVLMTFATARYDICAYDDNLLKKLLARTCEALDIKTLPTLVQALKRWPWLQSWHGPRVELVWSGFSDAVRGAERVDQMSTGASRLLSEILAQSRKNERWFVGGLEFYNSL